jgi:hypothetical protein
MEPITAMKVNLERQRLLKTELNLEETTARDYKKWLTDHPHADADAITEVRSRLKASLQRICDLVCEIKGHKRQFAPSKSIQ